VNQLDVAIIVAAGAAAIGGWRLGFVARALAWVGVAIGLVGAVPFVATVVTNFGGDDPDSRVTVALVFLVLCGAGGQALGILIGTRVGRLRAGRPRGSLDRACGALAGALGVLVVVWMLLPSLAVAAGWPARATRESRIIEIIDTVAPTPPDAFARWGRAVADAPYPSALDPLDEPPDPGTAPRGTVPNSLVAKVRRSVVQVTGIACRNVQEGSGFVARDEIVVTNAHVVAGESATSVVDASGRRLDATVVGFDPERDLALLQVDGLGAPPLALGRPTRDVEAAVLGYPGGGAMRATPARVGDTITARGTDIYRRGRSTRAVVVLAARLKPGDSGGAVVGADGAVVGVAFAIDPGSRTTAYALAPSEVEATLALLEVGSTPRPVGTGRCLS
jgi:S1-C subfamily serine protease